MQNLRISKPLAFWIVFLLMFLVNVVHAADSVSVENSKPGTTDWQITNEVCDYPASCSRAEIEGFASRTSVNQGDPITFFVSTSQPYTAYTLKIFRIGWYQGLGGRLVLGPISLTASPQAVPPPDSTGKIECEWNPSYPAPPSPALVIPSDWTSGVYLVKLEAQISGKQNYIIFTVRDDARASPYVFKSSVATYQAYNDWGGISLYTEVSGIKNGHRVSFNRPYASAHTSSGARLPGGGTGHFLFLDVNTVRWLERQGYDVTYITDIDLHENPDIALGHKALLIGAHSEYWSWAMRANAERARELGVSLGFFCANTVYWQVRFEASLGGDRDRTMVGYKEDALSQDPYTTDTDVHNDRYITGFWSTAEPWKASHQASDPVNRPEETLLGVAYSIENSVADETIGDITVTDPSSWPSWLSQSTGLTAGSILPGVLGYEVDKLYGYEPTGTVAVSHSLFPKIPASGVQVPGDATVYTAPSGAIVLAAGSIYWGKGLDSYGNNPPNFPAAEIPAVQQMTTNFLGQALTIAQVASSFRLPATVTTNAAAAGYPASNAIDGSSSSQWVANLTVDNSNNNAWIRLDFGMRRWIQRVKWIAASGTPYPAYAPTDYTIQISADGESWQTVVSRSGTCMFNGDELVNEQARFLRLVTTKVADGTGWALSFFEFWAEGAAPPPSGRLRTVSGYGKSDYGYTYQPDYTLKQDSNATDLDFGTQWISVVFPRPSNNNGWYYIDLGNRKQIDRVRWLGATGTPYPNASPTAYSIYVSDDAINWTDVLDRSNSSQVVNGNEGLSAQGRYVGLASSQVSDGTGWGLSFFEFWAEGSDSDNVLAAKASASAEAAGYPVANAVDGQNGTQWVANLTVDFFHNNNAWIQLDFGSRKQIDRVRWRGASGTPYPAYSPTNYSFQVSDDGTNWTTIATRTNATAVINGDELINGQGRYLRLVTTQVADGTGWALSFFEFWAEGY